MQLKLTDVLLSITTILLLCLIHSTSFGRTDDPQTFKYMHEDGQ